MEGLPGQDFVYSRRVRGASLAYVGVAALAMAAVGASLDGPGQYLTAWSAAGLAFVVPALLLAPRALRQVDLGREPMRAWYLANASLFVGSGLVYLIGVRGWTGGRPLLLLVTVMGIAVFGVANGVALGARSGQRAMLVDLFDLLVATVAILGPVALLVAEPIVTSDHAWLTVPAVLVVVGGLHAIGAAALTSMRLSPADHLQAAVCVGICAATVLDAAGQIGQGVTDFGLPAAPLLGLHTLTMSGCLLVGSLALRGTPRGLDRFPPQRQVRKNGPVAVLVLVSVAVMAVEVAWRHEEGWVVVTAAGLLASIAVLSTLRQVSLARETTRLYGEVERAADERLDLLADVMRYIDGDRTRAAAQIHRQAATLYTAMALSARADTVTTRVRVDLARQVDAAHEVLATMRTSRDALPGLERLAGLIRAYVGTLYGDAPPPALDVDIADGLVVDWLDEAVAFRIVQLAAHNVRRHAGAGAVTVSLREDAAALTVEVGDDGVGFDPVSGVGGVGVAGTGIATMRALAELVGGRVAVDSAPGAGTRVTAVLSGAGSTTTPAAVATPGGRRLQLVSGGRPRPGRR